MQTFDWQSRIQKSRVLRNGYIRGLGVFMLLLSVCSLSHQFASVSEKGVDTRYNVRMGVHETFLVATQKKEEKKEKEEEGTRPEDAKAIEGWMAWGLENEPVAVKEAASKGTNMPIRASVARPRSVKKKAKKSTLQSKKSSIKSKKPTIKSEKPVIKSEKPTIKSEKPVIKSEKRAIKSEKWSKRARVTPKRISAPRQHVKEGSKGILLCLHDGILALGISLIRELRCLGNFEAIEVHHCHDLSRSSVDLLYGLDTNIQVIDLCDRYVGTKLFSPELAASFQSYWIKPLAIHYTNLEQVIFLDTDVILLKDPAIVRSNEGYEKTGTLFFYDRVINTNQYLNKRNGSSGSTYLHEWLKTFDYQRFGLERRTPSAGFKSSFIYRGKTAHEQDSSMLVINKRHADKAMNVLWFLITEERFRYTFSWGDKEAFWLAYEFSQTPYFFSPWGASVVSATPNQDMERHPETLCGSLAHFEPTLNASAPPELLYVNGRALVDPVPFRLHKLKLLQPNLVFNSLPTHVTPRQKRRAPVSKGEWPECLTGMGSTPAPAHLLPNLWRRRAHFQAISMGLIEPLLECSDPGPLLPDIPPPPSRKKMKKTK